MVPQMHAQLFAGLHDQLCTKYLFGLDQLHKDMLMHGTCCLGAAHDATAETSAFWMQAELQDQKPAVPSNATVLGAMRAAAPIQAMLGLTGAHRICFGGGAHVVLIHGQGTVRQVREKPGMDLDALHGDPPAGIANQQRLQHLSARRTHLHMRRPMADCCSTRECQPMRSMSQHLDEQFCYTAKRCAAKLHGRWTAGLERGCNGADCSMSRRSHAQAGTDRW